MKPALRFAAVYVVLSAVLGGLALLQSFPARPTSWVGWLLLFALVLPVTVAAEFVGANTCPTNLRALMSLGAWCTCSGRSTP